MEKKNCERCGQNFNCQVNNISECWCMEVNVSTEVRRTIAASYTDCLCAGCLTQLQSENKPQPIFSGKRFIEGEDFYYTPEGYMVFTAKYHTDRGYCCGNGCRHCPY